MTVADKAISKRHVQIEYGDLSGAAVTNLSANPLWLNHKRISTNIRTPLVHGDILELQGADKTKFKFKYWRDSPPADTTTLWLLDGGDAKRFSSPVSPKSTPLTTILIRDKMRHVSQSCQTRIPCTITNVADCRHFQGERYLCWAKKVSLFLSSLLR